MKLLCKKRWTADGQPATPPSECIPVDSLDWGNCSHKNHSMAAVRAGPTNPRRFHTNFNKLQCIHQNQNHGPRSDQ